MDKNKRLYDLDKGKVTVCMIVDMVIFLVPVIIFAVVWGILEAQYLAIEDKSSVDLGPHFFAAGVLFLFVPISLGAPLTLLYRKLWKQPISFRKLFMIVLVPFLPGFILFLVLLVFLPVFGLFPFSVFFAFFLISLLAILRSEKEKFLE
ncbi:MULTISPECIES: hypothetical protein [unclassified Fibrobacter]|uniref:hypothetical protein n=1 Tax=unclassified Fibrobacter TaxID=2634177 RepID=UPI00111486DE|nr:MULTISPECIES: hypothetical protein [unclassified Fibrobacter]MBR2058178.1 hypothetical protein [Fibrobacter sp.]MBR2308485.1 hypothetical protein [Fibrobacter sp.]MBR4008714.1 hypothetical protein [Fibrobacter sp.]